MILDYVYLNKKLIKDESDVISHINNWSIVFMIWYRWKQKLLSIV